MSPVDHINIVSENPGGDLRRWHTFAVVRKDNSRSLFFGESTNTVSDSELTEFPATSFEIMMKLIQLKLTEDVRSLALLRRYDAADAFWVTHNGFIIGVRGLNYMPATGRVVVWGDDKAPLIPVSEAHKFGSTHIPPLEEILYRPKIVESIAFTDTVAEMLGVPIASKKVMKFSDKR